MPGSFHCVYLHIVFSTQGRRPCLVEAQRDEVFHYMAGILRNLGCQFVLVNGHSDHAHVVCTLPVDLSLKEVVGKLKGSSSRWVRSTLEGMEDFRWQAGYAAFSFSPRQLEGVRGYVRNQHEHHKLKCFEEEYREFLEMAAIEYEERYLFG